MPWNRYYRDDDESGFILLSCIVLFVIVWVTSQL